MAGETSGASNMDFATEIRVRTKRQHSSSNAIVNLTAPLAFTSPKVYRIALKAFYHVFVAIEVEIERLRRLYPKVGALYFPEITRVKNFEEDLSYYYGPSWRSTMGPPSPATVAWVSTLESSVSANPLCIIAYSQTMYVGMFAGGQIIKGWCRRAFGLKGKDGIRAFDFEDSVSDLQAFRKRYNEALNSLALSRSERDLIVSQKQQIFKMNDALFAELRAANEYRRRVMILVLGFATIVALLLLTVSRLRS